MKVHVIHAYTDGCCLGNPGPMGAACILVHPRKTREVAEALGNGTNNQAELHAIRLAAETINPAARKNVKLIVVTDSTYCIGALGGTYKLKKNVSLVTSIRKTLSEFNNVVFVKKRRRFDDMMKRADDLANEVAAKEKGYKHNLVNSIYAD